MKFDMDIAKRILETCEGRNENGWFHISYPDVDQELLNYHIELLNEEGLIKANGSISAEDAVWMVNRMTMPGIELLSKLRTPMVWDRAKQELKDKGIVNGTFGLMLKVIEKKFVEKTGL